MASLSVRREPAPEAPTAPAQAAEAGERGGAKVARMPRPEPSRLRLPDERRALTHKFNVGGHEGYLTVGLYEDGRPGEIFLRMAKEGSTISGLVDTIATQTSLLLQLGVSIDTLAKKFRHTRFEPCGYTGNPEISWASSIPDYVFHYLQLRFGETDEGAGCA